MQMQLAIFNITTDAMIVDWSTRVTACHVRTNKHGYESCEATLQIPFLEAFNYYQQLGPLKLKISWGGSYRVWEGRLEDPTQFVDTTSGLKITAFGGWVAFNDIPYVALWSDTSVKDWIPALASQIGSVVPDRATFDTNERIYIAPQKNASFDTAVDVQMIYIALYNNPRVITGVQFDYEMIFPNANWGSFFRTINASFATIATPWGLTATGVLQSGTINLVLTGSPQILSFIIYFAAGATAFAGETGSAYLKITNFRLVTSTANRINTTLGTNIAAGTRTVTPASMARIYVGQRLFIDQGSVTVGESVIVTAITATTFTAVFAFAHVIASTVTAHVVYPDEIIKDCISVINAINPTQVASSTDLIQSQAVDIDQALYEDEYPTDIINQLIARSDDQSTPRQWVAMVYDQQRLIVRPRGTGVAWYTDITSLEVVRTLTQLYNSVYAVYKDVSDKRDLRTVPNTDATSVTKFQITRRKPVQVDTTSLTQAEKARDSVLALQLDPIPRASIKVDRIFDIRGNPFPLFYMRADDTLTLRNLPPILGSAYDKIRVLVITRTDVDLIANTMTLELEIPMPDLSVQLAKALKGV